VEHWSDTTQTQKTTSSAKDSDSTEVVEQPDGAAQLQRSAITEDTAMDEADWDGVSAPPPHHHPPLQTFPKEFNKSYLESLDRRYVAILIFTLLLEPLLIWYMLRTHPLQMTESDIAKMQNRYVELFLSEFKEETPTEMPSNAELLQRAAEQIPQIVGESSGIETNLNLALPKRSNLSPEARALPGENREAVRRLNTKTRQRGMQALSEQVERIGLLGVITSGSGMISRAPVTDILEHADSTIGDIDNAIAQVKELRIPRAGVDYFGPSLGGGPGSARRGNAGSLAGQVFIAPKEVRGKRATSSGVMPEDIVTGLAAAPQKTIERNQSFEPVASTPALLPMPGISGLRPRPAIGQATRDRDKIREVVLAHNPAIQDCYRRQLKDNTALKGKVTVRFTINPLGYIVHAEILNTEITADGAPVTLAEMEECILTKIRRWRDFGKVDEAQGDVTFRQTYNFGY
jgi:hypothetical protein